MSKVAAINRFLARNLGIEIIKTKRPALLSNHAPRFLYFTKRFMDARDVEGDIVECGVGSGRGLISWFLLGREIGPQRMVYACDTYSGFPKLHELDGDLDSKGKGVGYLATSTKEVRDYMKRAGLSDADIDGHTKFVVGDVAETLPELAKRIDKIAILNIDLDLYEGYQVTLKTLFDKVVPGGIIMFDEYINSREMYPGPEIAVNEFLGDRKDEIRHDERANRYYMFK